MPHEIGPGVAVTYALPTVQFSRLGGVSAAEAARYEQSPQGGDWEVYVLHPQGGRVTVCFEPEEALAEATVRNLNGLLGAWAVFSVEA